jgi:hypothetical protein
VKVWVYHGDEIPQAEQETERLRARALAQVSSGGGSSTGALITDVREAAEVAEPEAPAAEVEPEAASETSETVEVAVSQDEVAPTSETEPAPADEAKATEGDTETTDGEAKG